MHKNTFDLNELEDELKKAEDYLSKDVLKTRKPLGTKSTHILANEEKPTLQAWTSAEPEVDRRKAILKSLNTGPKFRPSDNPGMQAPQASQTLLEDRNSRREPTQRFEVIQHSGEEDTVSLKFDAVQGSQASHSPAIKSRSATKPPPTKEDRESIVKRLLLEREQRLKRKMAELEESPNLAPSPGNSKEDLALQSQALSSFSVDSQTRFTEKKMTSSSKKMLQLSDPPGTPGRIKILEFPTEVPGDHNSLCSPSLSVHSSGGTPQTGSSYRSRKYSSELFFASDLADTIQPGKKILENLAVAQEADPWTRPAVKGSQIENDSPVARNMSAAQDADHSVHSVTQLSLKRSQTANVSEFPSILDYVSQSSSPQMVKRNAWEVSDQSDNEAGDQGLSDDSLNAIPTHPSKNKETARQSLLTTGTTSRPKGIRTAKLKQDAETKFKENYTFKPKINKNYILNTRKSASERIEELARPHADKQMERERLRLEKERELNKQCTFKPRLTKKAREQLAERGTNPIRASERLFRGAQEREAFQACARYHLDEAQMKECPFQPQIRTGRFVWEDGGYRPIHERLSEVQRYRDEHLTQLREEREAELTVSGFVPRINSKSERMAREMMVEDGSADLDVGSRLHRMSMELEHRRMNRLQQHELNQEQQRQHRPFMTAVSQKLVNANPEISVPFIERQENADARYQERNKSRLEQKFAEEQDWFKPDIGRSGDILNKKRPDIANESIADRVARLNREAEIIEDKRAKRAQEEYQNLNFKPDINTVSRMLAMPSSEAELVHNFRGQHRRKQAQKQEEERFKRECTFKPELQTNLDALIDSQSVFMTPYGTEGGGSDKENRLRYSMCFNEPWKLNEKIQERQKKREMAIQQQKMAKDVEEMSSCTFQPELKKPVPQPKGPVIVRGLGRHLELKDLKRRQDNDLKMREEKAFQIQTHNQFRAENGTTEFRPFQLSEGIMSKKDRVAKETEARQQTECPFKPQLVTNNSKRTDPTVIKHMLSASSFASSDFPNFEEEDQKPKAFIGMKPNIRNYF